MVGAPTPFRVDGKRRGLGGGVVAVVTGLAALPTQILQTIHPNVAKKMVVAVVWAGLVRFSACL